MLRGAYFSDIRRYVSKTKWEPVGFFSEGLCNSNSFNLKLGFFSSSAINLLSDGFAEFLYNGGNMRMIINDILSSEDKDAIRRGGNSSSIIDAFDLTDIEGIKTVLDERGKHFFDCLSWLIQQDRISIKIIAPKDGYGISHFKCGFFSDAINQVAFEGSCNFSRTALLQNNESLSIFCDWDGIMDKMRASVIKEDFEKTFSGADESVRYLDSNNLRSQVVSSYPVKDIQQLLDEEKDIISHQQQSRMPITVAKALSRAKEKVEHTIEIKKQKEMKMMDELDIPHFPYSTGPRPYQQEAFTRWKANNQRGLFAMATGTGKTITSLNCLLQIYNSRHYYKALILVPTITLVDQWKEECEKFHFQHIIIASSQKDKKWHEELANISLLESMDPVGDKNSYIIISTYASFSRENIFNELNVFPRKKLLLIADEAHNMGAPSILNRLDAIHYLRRIGLSATPTRQYDDEGNAALRKFFGAEEGYTYEFSMKEAIEKGFLCRYYYYPHLVRLTDSEMTEYLEISKKLAPMFNYNTGAFSKNDSILTALLLKRKRIIHKAVNKIDVFRNILLDRYKQKGNLKYTLVYVPEGNAVDGEDADRFDVSEDKDEVNFTSHLIDKYTQIIKDVSPTTTVKRFTSDTQNRDIILEQFAQGKLEVLTSMKCLDEGVDVPRSELAIFCASTGNPRQFIQRRGRILRKHPDKNCAVIHDLVIAPEVSINYSNYKMERSLLAAELKRVRSFALLSENADAAISELEYILDYYKLSMF
ncbi:DEAD/DEAH box helicase family protein [Prevotella sp. AGR2160]|uniref:DEAD/DEAH box helicase family protein n=1 Tax=Prevotella sp. AGR2160 TaxID=1280674 RepID=UPI0004156927|nr:DEAD/DEAH box helicase family protein [Prevotella sp. AGR2160]